MQANRDHIFLLHNASLYVFFKGRLVQTLYEPQANELWLKDNKLITVQMDHEYGNTCIWTIDEVTGLLMRCRKMPRTNFFVEFAGLWRQYFVICSGTSGHQVYYDIDLAQELAPNEYPIVRPEDLSEPGRAIQIFPTIWPSNLRQVNWIRPEDISFPFTRRNTNWSWSMISDVQDKNENLDLVALSDETIWGYHNYYKLRFKAWSRQNPKIRMPQLVVLSNLLSDNEIGKLFTLIWPQRKN